MGENVNKNNRKVFLDYLRIVATLGVISVHVATPNYTAFYFNTGIWRVLNIFNCLGRWTPPIFVMISGALFLGREIEIKKLYSKYILRVALAALVWNFIYFLLASDTPLVRLSGLFGSEKLNYWTDLLRVHYHLWYVMMIIGLYMTMPILKRIADDAKLSKYFIILGVFFTCILPQIYYLAAYFGNETVQSIASTFKWDYEQGLFSLPLGYSFYFILGYYLSKMELSKKVRMLIYALGIIGFAFTAWIEKVLTFKTEDFILDFYDCLSFQVFLTTIAIFVFFKNINYKDSKFTRFIVYLSKISFGAYLVHALVIEQLNLRFHINTLTLFAPATPLSVALAEVVIIIIVFTVAMIISAILNLIPGIKKIV